MAGPHQGCGRYSLAVPSHHRHRADNSRSRWHPAPATVNGIAQKPIEGISMAYTFEARMRKRRRSATPNTSRCLATARIYHDGWIAATVPPQPPWLMGTAKMPDVLTGYKWELYNIAEDISQNNDLAAKNPDKLKELQGLFMDEARKYQVFPLDNSILERILAPRPSAVAGRTEFTYSGEVSGLPDGNAPNMLTRSYSITAEVEIPKGGAEGMLNTLGAASAAMASTCLRASRSSPTIFWLWNGSAGKASRRSRRANTPSCLISNTTAPASARVAPASCRWTARKWLTRRSRTRSRPS